MNKGCIVKNCLYPHYGKELCSYHYRYFKRHGWDGIDSYKIRQRKSKKQKTCAYCSKPYYAKNMCVSHYLMLKRGILPEDFHLHQQWTRGDTGYIERKSYNDLYRVYSNMMGSCYSDRHVMYKKVGGRGIKICERWKKSFWDFLQDIGERPDAGDIQLEFGRIDIDKDFSPENCAWVEPVYNRRHRKLSMKDIEDIQLLLRGGNFRQGIIAKMYDVNDGIISKIKSGDIWNPFEVTMIKIGIANN